ncbi:creatininase family protein [Methylobacillus arboreus]|uniref:creatininase family protein n=1 Tax=Methylobacillus arboreus TaxID=755170 RepID=UPI001E50D1A6|nr:creatininase family protein [Methylobacillus arboreus]MCB5189413.1 creatininase family protein [Methylobacillus arboreus]
MASPSNSQWSQATWQEIPALISQADKSAILPVGATEQHGPHMGCGMDTVLADVLCRAVADALKVPMLPVLPYGCSLGHSRRWPGTIALNPVTLINVVKEIGDWAYYSGVRRLFIVNSHVTNAAPLRCALEMLRSEYDDMMVSVINTATMSPRVKQFHHADGDDWHANDAETSLMLAQAPEMVREDQLDYADDPDRTGGLVFSHPVNRTSLNGVTGRPSISSAEKGSNWFEWMVEDLSQIISKGRKEQPPLVHSYSSRAPA